MADALQYLHGREVLHRDLSPFNVFVKNVGRSKTQHAKIGDFGMSVQNCGPSSVLEGWEAEGSAPLDSSAVGSLYSAPELGGSYGLKADIFSLGMTIYALWLSGSGVSVEDTIDLVGMLKISHLLSPAFFKSCPCGELVQQMILKDPALRPDASTVYHRLLRILPNVKQSQAGVELTPRTQPE
jgi:serine/threonine protein kinase